MTDNRIQQALARLFERHRIVFWYDEHHEFQAEFDQLSLPEVQKCQVGQQPFTLKHQLLRAQPKQPFLLYFTEPEPEYLDNWLLDVQLSQGVFRTDPVAIWLSELNVSPDYANVLSEHRAFFEPAQAPAQAELRKQRLQTWVTPDDLPSELRLKMLAVCADLQQSTDVRLDTIVECLLEELIDESVERYALIERCQLQPLLWEQIERHYGYASETPSVKDFSIELFKACYALSLSTPAAGQPPRLNQEALVLFKRWKDSRTHQAVFEALSEAYAQLLDIESDLNQRDVRELIDIDYYRLVDQKVIADLVKAVELRSLSVGEVEQYCRARRQSHWYADFQPLYLAIEKASAFLALLDTLQLTSQSSSESVQAYVRHGFKLDQLYRQCRHAMSAAGEVTLVQGLEKTLENRYQQHFVHPLANQWQAQVDQMDHWSVPDVTPQRQFFQRWVRPFTQKKQKICVIISDAFRYEAAEEMSRRINRENKYQATLDHLLSALPSYTQLGMASLLPQAPRSLSINEQDASVWINGVSTQGTANRDKLLKAALPDHTPSALKAEAVLAFSQAQGREWFKQHDVTYLYHNRIDHTGDKMHSEGDTFAAVEDTFEDLLRLVKKLINSNVSNLLITADHGFLYQHSALDDSDFVADEVQGEVCSKSRRFLLGQSLLAGSAARVFEAEQLGLVGPTQAAIPKGTQRFRLSGAGSRFVHGGASLQEVIVPVITIKKKRQDDIATVEVDLLRGSGGSVITAGQLSVTLYQTEAVSDKLKPRELKAGLYTTEGQLISDQHQLTLDFSAEHARERELKLRFVLTQDADQANNQDVTLKLESPVPGTNQYTEYKRLNYTLRRSFTSDFDF